MIMESPSNLFLEFGHSLSLCIDANQGKVEACLFFHSFVIRHLSFVISFAWLRIGNFAIAGLISKSQKLEGKTCFT